MSALESVKQKVAETFEKSTQGHFQNIAYCTVPLKSCSDYRTVVVMVARFGNGSTRLPKLPYVGLLKSCAIMLKRFSSWASSFRNTKTYPKMKEWMGMLFGNIGQSECFCISVSMKT